MTHIMQKVPRIEDRSTAILAPASTAVLVALTAKYAYDQFINNNQIESPYSGLEYIFNQYINQVGMLIAPVASVAMFGVACIRSYEYFAGEDLF